MRRIAPYCAAALLAGFVTVLLAACTGGSRPAPAGETATPSPTAAPGTRTPTPPAMTARPTREPVESLRDVNWAAPPIARELQALAAPDEQPPAHELQVVQLERVLRVTLGPHRALGSYTVEFLDIDRDGADEALVRLYEGTGEISPVLALAIYRVDRGAAVLWCSAPLASRWDIAYGLVHRGELYIGGFLYSLAADGCTVRPARACDHPRALDFGPDEARLDLHAVVPGDEVTISAPGFLAGERVRVVLAFPPPGEFDPDQALGETTASASGEATLTFTMPEPTVPLDCVLVLLFDDGFRHKPGALLEVLSPDAAD